MKMFFHIMTWLYAGIREVSAEGHRQQSTESARLIWYALFMEAKQTCFDLIFFF